jgi:hypothetical protein
MAQRRSTSTKLDKPTLWTEDAQEQAASTGKAHADNQAPIASAPEKLVIDHLVLHYLDPDRGTPVLVDMDADLDDAMHAYFAHHISYADTNAEWQAEFDDPSNQAARTCASLLRGGSDDFAQMTHYLANSLNNIMGAKGRFRKKIAPGDMIVVLYHSADSPSYRLAILKVELDKERHTREFVESNGRRKVVFKPTRNLLPLAERLQKCAIVWFDADDTAPSLRLLDKDAGPASQGIAAFFYKDFLGASLGMSPKRRTRLFWSETNRWINAKSRHLGPHELLRFFQTRRAALSGATVDVQRFVADALPNRPHEAQALLSVLTTKLHLLDDVGALEFEINASVAKAYTEHVTLLLDGKMKLAISANQFQELVHVSEDRTGEGKITITLETVTFQEISG